MSLITLGLNFPAATGNSYLFDPKLGLVSETNFEGLEAQLLPMAGALRSLGLTARVSQVQGPKYRLTVQIPQPLIGQPTTSDRYDFRTDIVEVDIRNHPNVIAAAGTSDTLALWIKDINQAVAAGEALTGTVDPAERSLYDFWARGGRTYLESRLVLRRSRTRWGTADKLLPTVIPSVYSTAKLVQTFALPGDVSARLPADPATTPSGPVWAWWRRTHETSYIQDLNRDEETMEWVFAAWSTLTYTVIS